MDKMRPSFKDAWLQKLYQVVTQTVFNLWAAFLIYSVGPYYAFIELFRNLQIFGYKKLNYDKEFKGIDLNGKVCVLTGGTRGIGLETIKYLYSKNCTIITGTSKLDEEASEKQIEEYRKQLLSKIDKKANSDERLFVLPLDLANLDSVKKFADKICKTQNKIDYLVCNGGVMFVPFKLSHDRFEGHMIINYYSHCLLIAKLLTLMAKNNDGTNSPSRIIIVSSVAHHASLGLRLHDLNSINLWSTYHGYCQSKLALIMFTYYFHWWIRQGSKWNDVLLGNAITINCLHPGMCRTGLMDAFNFIKYSPIKNTLFFRAPSEGAETILFATLSRCIENISGKYLEDCRIQKTSPLSYDQDLQKELWNRTWNDLKPWLSNQEIINLTN